MAQVEPWPFLTVDPMSSIGTYDSTIRTYDSATDTYDADASGPTPPTGTPVLMILEGGPLDGEQEVVENVPTWVGAELYFNVTNFQTFDPSEETETVLAQGLEAIYSLVRPGPSPGPDDRWVTSWVFDFTGEAYIPTPGPLPPGPPVEYVALGQVWMSATTSLVPDTLPITSEPVVPLVAESTMDIEAVATSVKAGVVAMTGETVMTVMADGRPKVFMNATSSMEVDTFVGAPPGAPDVIQCTGSVHYGAVSPATPAFNGPTSLGDTLIAVIGTGNSSTVTSITGLGTWVKAVSLVGIEIWYCLNCTTSGTTITINWSATPSASSTACLLEIPQCSGVDVTANASGSAAGAQGPGTLTPTAHGDFFVTGLNSNGTPTAVNGHMAAMSDVGDINVVYQFQRADQQNPYTPAWTTTSGAWVAVGAAFKVVNPRTAYTVTNNTAFVSSEESPQIDVYENGVHAFRMLLWGNDDNGSALSPDRTRLWQTINVVPNNSGAIQIIDTASMTGIYAIQYPLTSPNDPVAACFSLDGTKVYVANAQANTVTVFNAATYALIATIPCGTTCHRVACSPDGTKVYATNSFATGGPGTLSVISTATNTVTATLTLGADPWEIAFMPSGPPPVFQPWPYAYVAGGSANDVAVIAVATNTVLTTIGVGGGAHGVGMTPDGQHVYVSNNADDTVSVISTVTNAVVGPAITVGSGPTTVRVKHDGTEVWVTNNNDTTVSVISTVTNTVTKTLPAGTDPNGLSL